MNGNVVRVNEADRRLAIKGGHVSVLKMRVVIDSDVVETRHGEKTIGDAGEQVVCDHQVVTTS